jgi:hypothetical protein
VVRGAGGFLLPLLLLRPSNTSTGMAEMAADDSPSCSRPWPPQQQQQRVGQAPWRPLMHWYRLVNVCSWPGGARSITHGMHLLLYAWHDKQHISMGMAPLYNPPPPASPSPHPPAAAPPPAPRRPFCRGCAPATATRSA